MRNAMALLCAAVLLSGCGTVGNVLKKTGQVLMDPDIQVGGPEDQPTQVALSLYAGANVNPNAVEEPEIEPEPDLAFDEGPYALNLHTDTREELVRSLRALLDHLEEEGDGAPTAVGPADPSSMADAEADSKLPALAAGAGSALSWPPTGAATSRAPFPPHWRMRQGGAALGGPGPDSEEGGNGGEHDVDLGQYREGVPLAPAAQSERQTQVNATPVAFRVIQLKDDSMLENADPELVRNEPKKALGSTFLTADDYVLLPGQFKFINYRELDEDTRYVAVVAAFHDPNAQRWYDVFRVEPRGRKYALLVTLQDTRVAITDENYRAAQAVRRAPTQARKQP